MRLTKPRTKTEIELFQDKVKERETALSIKIPFKVLETNHLGEIVTIETNNQDLINWLQARGFS